MIKNCDEVKPQLRELTEIVSACKFEAVQSRVEDHRLDRRACQ
jgi:hypothetical protein